MKKNFVRHLESNQEAKQDYCNMNKTQKIIKNRSFLTYGTDKELEKIQIACQLNSMKEITEYKFMKKHNNLLLEKLKEYSNNSIKLSEYIDNNRLLWRDL